MPEADGVRRGLDGLRGGGLSGGRTHISIVGGCGRASPSESPGRFGRTQGGVRRRVENFAKVLRS
jgi:hypothetical protein